jgi:hypothetical protein
MSSAPQLSTGKRILFALVTTLIFLLMAELASRVAFVIFDAKTAPSYNRVASGYSVFRTTPNYQFITIKSSESDTDVITDAYGFVHDTPIEVEKPPNTVRIFLNGGSALFGAGQAAVYSPPKDYPGGLFAYRLSIAGKLRQYLEKKRPDLRFEVVNAAAYTKQMHQSLPDYVSTISRFDPDFVINMDGYNDLSAFVTGTPFLDLEPDLWKYVALLAPPSFPENTGIYQILTRAVSRLISPFKTGLGASVDEHPPDVTLPRSHYEKELREGFVENTGRYLEILDYYMSVLKQDGVDFLFILQPMVDREVNKEFTPSEAEWQRYTKRYVGARPEYRYVLRYFFDDHLSGAVKQRVEAAGNTYIDMGQAIGVLDSSFQFYTDYCHLTVEGNEFVAERMGEFVLSRLP